MGEGDCSKREDFLEAARRYHVSPEFLLDLAIRRYETRLASLMLQDGAETANRHPSGSELNPEFLRGGDKRRATHCGIGITQYHYQILLQYAEHFYFTDADKLIKYKKSLIGVRSVDQRIARYIETAISNFIDYLHSRETGG